MYIVAGEVVLFAQMNNKCFQMLIYTLNGILDINIFDILLVKLCKVKFLTKPRTRSR
jgi:hypothetical protein